MNAHRKTIIAVVGAIVSFATAVVTSDPGPVTSSEWLAGAVGVLTALGVYGVANQEVP